jgi:structural maintenance of chromosomes protein 6
VAGTEPETGIIVKVYCENFMCHRKLSVVMGPNVNFINGQNGSGKSAILAALQICLGARARITHRGTKLGDLVRQGHDGWVGALRPGRWRARGSLET